jgi:hypothetical protein
MKEIGNMTGMTRIDENRYLSTDQISVAVIFISILPKIGIEVSLKFHEFSLPLIFLNQGKSLFSLNDRRGIVK